MKTTEEIREEVANREGCTSFANLITTNDLSIGEKILEVDRCMKIYGKQCAEQALKDAAIRINETSNNEYGLPLDDYHAITNTPINTP